MPLMSSKFTVEFRIYGKALDPGAVTELLALEPCQVVLPVTRRGSRVVEEAMWAFNGSEDGEASSPEWSTLEEGLKSVLEKLWSRRDLIAQYNGASRKVWWCGQFHAGGTAEQRYLRVYFRNWLNLAPICSLTLIFPKRNEGRRAKHH